MTTATDAQYARAVMACLTACAKWWADNPDARLKFNPITYPAPPGAKPGEVGGVITSLANLLELGVAGNSVTRKMLTAIDRACPNGGATAQMAQYAIEQVFGIRSALTRVEPNAQARMD